LSSQGKTKSEVRGNWFQLWGHSVKSNPDHCEMTASYDLTPSQDHHRAASEWSEQNHRLDLESAPLPLKSGMTQPKPYVDPCHPRANFTMAAQGLVPDSAGPVRKPIDAMPTISFLDNRIHTGVDPYRFVKAKSDFDHRLFGIRRIALGT
jgi:hypothetical protein